VNEPTPTAPLIEQFQSATRASSAVEARMLAERMLRGSELALEAARHEAREASQACEELSERILELEEALERSRRTPDDLMRQIADEQRGRRLAEQQAFAERARREELQAELAEARVERDPAAEQADEQAAREHERELQAEIRELRRRADELEHLAAAATLARDRAEGRLNELRIALADARARPEPVAAPNPEEILPPPQDAGRSLADEFAVAARAADGWPALRRVESVRAPSGGAAELALERELTDRRRSNPARNVPVVASATGSADAGLQAVASLSASMRLAPALAELREELSTLSAIVKRERSGRLAAEERARALEVQLAEQLGRSARAYQAIEGLRGRLAVVGGWGAPAGGASGSEPPSAEPRRVLELAGRLPEAPVDPEAEPEPPAGAPLVGVEPERFTDALTRLRTATPARETETETETETAGATTPAPEIGVPDALPATVAPAPRTAARGRWLHRAFRELVRRDLATAGQFVLELLPAQRLVHPRPVAYDLELSFETCVQVTVTTEAQTLAFATAPRPPGEANFVISGDRASLARLLGAGRIGRRLRRGMPQIRGDRRKLAVLDELVRAPLTLHALRDAGVSLDPGMTLALVAAMIEPGWTRGSRFELAYRAGEGAPVNVLTVRDGAPVQTGETVSDADPTAVLTLAPDELLALLDGDGGESVEVDGDPVALTELQSWVKRAQSG
jgi:hypothetical protein